MSNQDRPSPGGTPGGISPDKEDIAAYRRQRQNRMVDRVGDVPDVGGGGGGGSWLLWLLVLALAGGGYYLYQQLDLARAQLMLDQQRIARLEKQLHVTDESVSESSDAMQKQVKFLDHEIRKLWDNVWKKSREQLEDHEKRLAALDKQLASIESTASAARQTAQKDRKALEELQVQQQKTRNMAETNWSQIAELQENAGLAEQIASLESRIKANEEWLESVDVFRKQVNRDLTNLRETMASHHPERSASATSAQ